MSWNSTVSIATGHEVDGQGSTPWVQDFSLLCSMQKDPGAQTETRT
jgi:hypothetical protein